MMHILSHLIADIRFLLSFGRRIPIVLGSILYFGLYWWRHIILASFTTIFFKYIDAYSIIIALHLCMTFWSFFLHHPLHDYKSATITRSKTGDLVALIVTIHISMMAISEIPDIPWMNFWCHILGYLAQVQLLLLLLGIGKVEVNVPEKEKLEWGLDAEGQMAWLTPLMKEQANRVEGVMLNLEKRSQDVVDRGRDWGAWNRRVLATTPATDMAVANLNSELAQIP